MGHLANREQQSEFRVDHLEVAHTRSLVRPTREISRSDHMAFSGAALPVTMGHIDDWSAKNRLPLEKLGESGEADAVRLRHRDYYAALAAVLDSPAGTDYERRLEQAETEIDNLRAAFVWSREHSDIELALALASSLQPLWLARGRIREGWAWFKTVLTDDRAHDLEVAAAVRARALADSALLDTWVDAAASVDRAQQALVIARELDDPALLVPALTVCGLIASYSYSAEVARTCFAEALGLARALNDRWRLSQILALQAAAASVAGDPIAARAAGEEGRDVADAIGDRFDGCHSRVSLGCAGDAGRAGRSRRTVRRTGGRGRVGP